MAAGYENRPAGRASFAFDPGRAFQDSPSARGVSRGAQVQGGNSQGGVERAVPITAPTDSGVPEFIARAMEPHVQRKQAEGFVRGGVDRARGISLEEIHKSGGLLSKIFGPSSYEQGAAAYEANRRVADWQSGKIEDIDNLKRLDPDGLSKVVFDSVSSMMTGNSLADAMIQQGILDKSQPLIQLVEKERYKWKQEQAASAQAGSADSEANALQRVAVTQARLTAPDEKASSALEQQRASFLSSFQQPPGMADDTYQTFLFNSARNMQAKGNFYGYEALKGAGLTRSGGPLTDEQITRLETGYASNANRLLGEAAHDPAVVAARLALDVDIKAGRITSPMEAAARLEGINSLVARRTGITDERLYDASAVTSVGTAVTDAAIGAARRIEERQWQIEDRKADQQFQLDREAAERAQKVAAAQNFVANGQAKTGLATGLGDAQDYNVVFGNALQAGNMGVLASNFDRETYKNDYAADVMQSGVKASIGVGLTDGFNRSYQQWEALHKISPAAATAYMGEYGAMMEAYDTARKGGDTALSAYAQTFGNPNPVSSRGRASGKIDPSIISAIKTDDATFSWRGMPLSAGRMRLKDDSTQRLAGWLQQRAEAYATTAGIPIGTAAAKVYRSGLASGEIERAGPLAWVNPHRATPLGEVLHQPAERVDEAVTAVVDTKLKAAGFASGITGNNMTVMRVADRSGVAALVVQAMSDDGETTRSVPVSSRELLAYLDGKAREAVAANQPKPKPQWIKIDSASNRQRAQSYVDTFNK